MKTRNGLLEWGTGAITLVVFCVALVIALALAGCDNNRPPVIIGPVLPVPTTTVIPGAHWRIIACAPTQRCIRWLDAQTSIYYQGPYDPNRYRIYGVRSDCAFLPQEGDAYVSEVLNEEVKNPPPAGCPLP